MFHELKMVLISLVKHKITNGTDRFVAELRAVSQQCHKANSAQRTPVIGHLGDMRTLAACVHMPDSDSRVEVDVHQTGRGRSIIAISFAAKFIIEISTS